MKLLLDPGWSIRKKLGLILTLYLNALTSIFIYLIRITITTTANQSKKHHKKDEHYKKCYDCNITVKFNLVNIREV